MLRVIRLADERIIIYSWHKVILMWTILGFQKISHTHGIWEGGSAGTSIRGPETQEGERLKSPKTLAIDILFWFFHFFGSVFNYFEFISKNNYSQTCFSDHLY